MTRGVTELVIVSALAALVALAVAAPVLRSPSGRVFGMPVVGRHHDPFTAMQAFGSAPLTGLHSQPLTDLPGAFISRFTGPVAAYNWLVLLTFPLSAAAAYALARHLTIAPVAAAAAAFAFAFSPFHFAQAAYHPHIAQTQWMPLYLLALWRCLDTGTIRSAIFLAASTLGVVFSSFYGGLIAAVVTPIAMVAYWLIRGHVYPARLRRAGVAVATLTAIAACGMLYIGMSARVVLENPVAFAADRSDLVVYSASWWSYVVPPVANPMLGELARQTWAAAEVRAGLLEQQVSLGWGIMALGLVAIAAWLAGQRAIPSVATVPALASIAIFATVSSLPPEITIGSVTLQMPSALLYSVVPMFRAYARFGVIVQLMAVLLAAVGVERLWHSQRRAAHVACVGLLVLSAAEYAVRPSAMSRDVLPTSAHRWLAGLPGGVRALDCTPPSAESQSIPWLTGGRISVLDGSLDDCYEPALATKLAARGYTHLLVRRGEPAHGGVAAGVDREGLEPAGPFDDADLFSVSAAVPAIYTAGMDGFFAREHGPISTWRWMGREASWTIVNTGRVPVIATALVELTAFHTPRTVRTMLDGADADTDVIGIEPLVHSIGPLRLSPGEHTLVFRPEGPPTIANSMLRNGDWRPLTIAFGRWRWVTKGVQP